MITVSKEKVCQIDRDRFRMLIEDIADGFYETNLKGDFIFCNDAFCQIFGYNCNELQNRNYREFMDEESAKTAFENYNNVYRTGKGITDSIWEVTRKDGKRRVLRISINLINDENKNKTGFRGIARDVTRERRAARSNQALFRIAKALPRYGRLNQLLEFITKEVQNLLEVEGASVILLDKENKEFYFPVATYDDTETSEKMKVIRFPVDKGVAGHVYRTGKPMIVPDTSKNPYFFKQVDEQAEYRTRNLLDVPIRLQDHMIGVLCAVNKKEREFDQADMFLLSTIASTVALPIENARINEELKRSYNEVKSLNRAKDRVINHLSHELKTPVSVLSASFNLLNKKFTGRNDRSWEKIMERVQRNIDRILEMQYEIEDILRERDYKTYYMLSTLLDVCTDELEALISEQWHETDAIEKIRNLIEENFGPRNAVPLKIRPDHFIKEHLKTLRPQFVHRKVRLTTRLSPTAMILIPPEILAKIATGLIRNAIENTPDKGRINVEVRNGKEGPEFAVEDFGIGITEDNQSLIFESIFSTHETLSYSSRHRYDFNAGGKGFDLLRIKIFSERYNFKIQMISRRCRFIPRSEDICPGDIAHCKHCQNSEDCFRSGGTSMIIRFSPADHSSLDGIRKETKQSKMDIHNEYKTQPP